MSDTINLIKQIIEEQRVSMTLEDDISLTNKTSIDEQEAIQRAWPKSITYKEALLFDQYNKALQQAYKSLDIDKTKVEIVNVDDITIRNREFAVSSRYVSTSDDKTANTEYEKRVRITGEIRYFAYIKSTDRFVLGFDMEDVEPVGNTSTNYVALVTCEIRFSSEYEGGTEIIIENTEKLNVNYDDNVEYMMKKVRTDNKEDDVIIIFTKEYFKKDDIYHSVLS